MLSASSPDTTGICTHCKAPGKPHLLTSDVCARVPATRRWPAHQRALLIAALESSSRRVVQVARRTVQGGVEHDGGGSKRGYLRVRCVAEADTARVAKQFQQSEMARLIRSLRAHVERQKVRGAVLGAKKATALICLSIYSAERVAPRRARAEGGEKAEEVSGSRSLRSISLGSPGPLYFAQRTRDGRPATRCCRAGAGTIPPPSSARRPSAGSDSLFVRAVTQRSPAPASRCCEGARWRRKLHGVARG